MIKRKREVSRFMKDFEVFSNWDGKKYYFTFETTNPLGAITLMKYEDEKFTYHRKNEVFWDIGEVEISTENLTEFVWEHRKAINKELKVTVC